MKIYRLCLIGLALLLCACNEMKTEGNATGPVVTIDGKEVRHGIWVETHPDGTRKSHGRFTRGIPTGLHRTWHPNGTLASERRHDWDGELHKKQTDFNEDGERIAKFFYEHGEKQIVTTNAVEEVEGNATEETEPPPAD